MVIRPWRAKVETAALLLIGLAPAEFNWAYNPHLVDHPAVFWLIDTLRWTALPALVFWIGIRRGLFTPAEVGFHRKSFGRPHWLWFVIALIGIPLLIYRIEPLLSHMSQSLGEQNFFPATFSYDQMMPASHNRPMRLLLAFYFAATAGIVEEFYYRGLIRHLIGKDEVQSVLFVLVSTALFCPPHIYGGSAEMDYAALYGLLFSVLYLWVGNLWPLILGHALIDFKAFS